MNAIDFLKDLHRGFQDCTAKEASTFFMIAGMIFFGKIFYQNPSALNSTPELNEPLSFLGAVMFLNGLLAFFLLTRSAAKLGRSLRILDRSNIRF